MTIYELFKLVLGIVGGGGLVIVSLSAWLGKVWAERIIERERAWINEKLATFKSQLERENAQTLARACYALSKKYLYSISYKRDNF